MRENRDGLPDEPLSEAERARRYRARLRGEDVPLGQPGRRPASKPTHAERAQLAAGALNYELGWLGPKDVDGVLAVFLDSLATQIARLRPHHD
jgi:hypothetical protein